MEAIQNVMEQQMVSVAQKMEAQLDAEINKLDNMDEDDYESLRRKRLAGLKKAQDQKREWLSRGHGQYEELPEEKEFFEVCKKSKNVVCHFYRDSAFRCKIVDKHLAILASKHVECKFVKINAEKAPFLTQRLKIVVIPTICISRDSKTVDFIVGFDDMGGTDDFTTEMMEWRIARAEVINYSGDLLEPPIGGAGKKKASVLGASHGKTIRERDDDSSDDDF